MKEGNLRIFGSPDETARAFGDYLIGRISKSDMFHCALSGGSTPKLLFRYLAEKYPDSEVWGKLHVYWGDERCVPPHHEESNFKMTDDLLLSKVPIPKAHVHRVRGEDDPPEEAERYSDEVLKSTGSSSERPDFDMIILGMGEDGHTASIFPHQMELLESGQVCAVASHPTSGQKRVTLTGPVINDAREVVFLVTGAGKKEKIKEIFEKSGAWETYPTSFIHPENGSLVWFMDEAAADGL